MAGADPVVQSYRNVESKESNSEVVLVVDENIFDELWNDTTQVHIHNLLVELLPDKYYRKPIHTSSKIENENKILKEKKVVRYSYFALPVSTLTDTHLDFYLDESYVNSLQSSISSNELKRLIGLQNLLYSTNGLIYRDVLSLNVRFIVNKTNPARNYREAVRLMVNYHHKLYLKLLAALKKNPSDSIAKLSDLANSDNLEKDILSRYKVFSGSLEVMLPFKTKDDALDER
jgi:hypothetical protein